MRDSDLDKRIIEIIYKVDTHREEQVITMYQTNRINQTSALLMLASRLFNDTGTEDFKDIVTLGPLELLMYITSYITTPVDNLVDVYGSLRSE